MELMVYETDYEEGGPGRIAISAQAGYFERIKVDVDVETAARWHNAWIAWKAIEAEIDHACEEAEKKRREAYQAPQNAVQAWFNAHNEKLRTDPTYEYPFDTVQFGGVSYSVNKKPLP